MNEGLFYSSDLGNKILQSNNNLDSSLIDNENSNDFNKQQNNRIRKYFPETWLWQDKIAEYFYFFLFF